MNEKEFEEFKELQEFKERALSVGAIEIFE